MTWSPKAGRLRLQRAEFLARHRTAVGGDAGGHAWGNGVYRDGVGTAVRFAVLVKGHHLR